MLRRANGTTHGLLATRCHRTLCKNISIQIYVISTGSELETKIYVPIIIPTGPVPGLACSHVSIRAACMGRKIRGASPLDFPVPRQLY